LLEEALAPLADDLAMGVQALCDLVVAEASGSEEDQPGPEDFAIR
jgi:hypothetical protein